jgi:5-methylcytosine-specific restriction endonuclease McrA
MMAIMHEAQPYGHLVIGRKPVKLDDVAPLALQVAAPIADVRKAIVELHEAEVFSFTDDGVIWSRRMVRDEAKKKTDKANGDKGGVPWAPRDGLTRRQREAAARTHTDEQWAQLIIECGDRCVLCLTPRADLHGATICKDHIQPISLGGSDGIDNLQPVCRPCNTKKGSRAADMRPPRAVEWARTQVETSYTTPVYNPRIQPDDNLKPSQAKPYQADEQQQRVREGAAASPVIDFGTWFLDAAIAAGVLGAHLAMMPGHTGFAYRHMEAITGLLGSHPLDEIKLRSERLFAWKKQSGPNAYHGEPNPTALAKCWDYRELAGHNDPARSASERLVEQLRSESAS